ncbi:hypothetical protein H4696_008576 [Amycolatopsis lexingtonensis]|uniref:Guanylate cyclase domain-containing protein n=1 Tax=Amycolatopsis lexingtonensis TaxID=218822 RepID=A0ABR9IE75_9PSEU|nr:hypothetical protein [Amycolatopsis lexingtonensis]MBE1501476.1 hypothetical protein [Amycolatopsis lexingtonensis]
MSIDEELPPYRALLVVDTKGFGSNSDADQGVLAAMIPDVLGQAFERAGLGEVWKTALFPHGTGDGYGVGFEPRFLPAVVSKFFDALENVLAERDVRLRATSRYLRMRMRASLNVGPIREADGESSAVAIGAAVITTHRLLDSAPVREVLTRSDPDQTFLSVVLSQRIFEDVLASGYATLPKSRVVPADVEVKEYRGTVYLYVPNPSGKLLQSGIGTEYEEKLAAAEKTEGTTNVITGMHGGTAIQIGRVHGNVNHPGS